MVNAIGIDLGTSKCCVGVFRNGKVEIIPNGHGNRPTPSYVAFTESERLFGNAAKDQLRVNPANTIFAALRLIGRKFNDATVQSSLKQLPFKVFSAENGRPKVQVEFKSETKAFYPEEVVAMMLAYLKVSAEAYLNSDVKDAVITVPASFNYAERQAIIDAGTIAGLNVIRIVAASTAAAMAYGFDTKGTGERNLLVFDLGGGAFNVTIISNMDAIFEVKATVGNAHLGGHDFDTRLVDHFVAEFKERYGKDLTSDFEALSRLRIACISAKHTLSTFNQVDFILEDLFDGIDFKGEITRARFEWICSDLFHKTVDIVESALQIAKLNKWEINDVVLLGGSTCIPMVRKLLGEFFVDKELIEPCNRDELAAYGAAIQAAVLSDKSKDNQNLLLLDVIPFTLGFKTADGITRHVYKRDMLLNSKVSKTITTKYGDQTDVLIQIYEVENDMTEVYNILGSMKLSGFPRAAFTDTHVKITFDVDSNLNIVVTAYDQSTGKTAQITIVNQNNCFTDEEVKRMFDEAEELKREERRLASKKNLIDYCNNTMQTLEVDKRKMKLREQEQFKIYKKCYDTLAWLKQNDAAKEEEFELIRKDVERACDSLGN
uniref:Heat shock protein 70 n=1 Tax=Panagrellus redivivus TaxID=6233 RepID=A0A7E4UW27_PANRE